MKHAYKIGDILPDATIYIGQNDAGLHIATTLENLPGFYNHEAATKAAQELHAHDYKDWMLPDLDECMLIYKASRCDNLKVSFDFSGAFPASAFWSARRYNDNDAYFQWVVDGNQYDYTRYRELPVRPVRRFKSLNPSVISAEKSFYMVYGQYGYLARFSDKQSALKDAELQARANTTSYYVMKAISVSKSVNVITEELDD